MSRQRRIIPSRKKKKKSATVILYLVHNAVAQHNLVRLCHSLTYHRSFCRTEQRVVAKTFVDSLNKVSQENLFVVLEARRPKTGNSSSEQLQSGKHGKVDEHTTVQI